MSVYQAHIPMEYLPSAKFVEPEEENFDRGEYNRPRVGVPIKVAVNKDGSVEILDGNHRVQTWEEQGQQYAPAWVIDRRGPGIEKLSEDELAERAEIEEEERQVAQQKAPAPKAKAGSQTEQPSIYTPEGAQPLAEKLGAKVVGSVTKKESERVPNAYGSTKPRDLDLRIEGEYKPEETNSKMKEAGFEPAGSSLVSPEEVKQSGKPYGKPGWKRAEHFENAAGEKIDVWHDEAGKSWEIHDLGKEHNIPSEEGYLYHATNHDRARDIAESGLDTHKPSYGTDQEAWPDGSTDKRSYFTKQADHAWQFSPEEGKPALLRMKQDPAIHSRESTGDFYSKKKIPANKIEVLGDDKQWHPISELSEPPQLSPEKAASLAKTRSLNLKHLGDPITEMDPNDARNWIGYDGSQKTIKVYRGVDAKGRTVEPGDFVSTSKESAAGYGPHIIEMDVPASDLRYVQGHQNGDPARVGQGGQVELLYAPKKDGKATPKTQPKNLEHETLFSEALAGLGPAGPKQVFHGTTANVSDISKLSSEFSKEGVAGRGVYLTETPEQAGAYAGPAEGGTGGRVLAGSLSDKAKLLDGNAALPDALRTKLQKKFSGDIDGSPKTYMEFMSAVRSAGGDTAGVQKILTDSGYHGVRYTGDYMAGQRKAIVLFENGKDLLGPAVPTKTPKK